MAENGSWLDAAEDAVDLDAPPSGRADLLRMLDLVRGYVALPAQDYDDVRMHELASFLRDWSRDAMVSLSAIEIEAADFAARLRAEIAEGKKLELLTDLVTRSFEFGAPGNRCAASRSPRSPRGWPATRPRVPPESRRAPG